MTRFALILLMGCAAFALHKYRLNSVNLIDAESTLITRSTENIPNVCQGKKYCFTAYLSPYCEICKGKIPTLNDLIDKSNSSHRDYGIKIIVGRGDKSENEKMAKRFKQKVIVDNNLAFSDELQVSRVPYFKLTDSNDNVMALDYEALNKVYKSMEH